MQVVGLTSLRLKRLIIQKTFHNLTLFLRPWIILAVLSGDILAGLSWNRLAGCLGCCLTHLHQRYSSGPWVRLDSPAEISWSSPSEGLSDTSAPGLSDRTPCHYIPLSQRPQQKSNGIRHFILWTLNFAGKSRTRKEFSCLCLALLSGNINTAGPRDVLTLSLGNLTMRPSKRQIMERLVMITCLHSCLGTVMHSSLGTWGGSI